MLSLEQGHPAAAAAAAEMLHQDRHLCALSLCLCGDRMRGCSFSFIAFHSVKRASLLTLPVKTSLLVQTFQICH